MEHSYIVNSYNALVDTLNKIASSNTGNKLYESTQYNALVFMTFKKKVNTIENLENKTIGITYDINNGKVKQLSFPAHGFNRIDVGVFDYVNFYLTVRLVNFNFYFDFVCKSEKQKPITEEKQEQAPVIINEDTFINSSRNILDSLVVLKDQTYALTQRMAACSSTLTEEERNLLFSLTGAVSTFSKIGHELNTRNTRLAASNEKTTDDSKANEFTNPLTTEEKLNEINNKISALMAEVNQLRMKHFKPFQGNTYPHPGLLNVPVWQGGYNHSVPKHFRPTQTISKMDAVANKAFINKQVAEFKEHLEKLCSAHF
jgi:hypothetical protein